MRNRCVFLVSLLFLLTPEASPGGERILPAGTLLQCVVSEPNFSSKTAELGDPVLCRASPVRGFGHFLLPYGTYLGGHFVEYRDPGHFVGKGWMQLEFDHLVVSGQVLPLAAKVVEVSGMRVDRSGRIQGHGHARRDTVEWLLPPLWPMKAVLLPARGPRPRLSAETRVTLKVMEDLTLPAGVTDTLLLRSLLR
jgi:hypothetical protein